MNELVNNFLSLFLNSSLTRLAGRSAATGNRLRKESRGVLLDSPVPDLPAEDAGVLLLVALDLHLDLWRGQLRLAAPKNARPDRTRLLVSVKSRSVQIGWYIDGL